ncbi:hypothetical protein [Sulfitobacter sp. S190]|uniref:hypothetical protein n=1 Tax=Sulfitobacter sp. S190 TaxID=2867022 RepID=UPI0021A6DB06|nr:hypothetical protein [Sulfitobacter sp. S190]UWR22680.1 hypothetical protein K3756_01395 [Sulfitobacter sp. S190]
MPSPSTDKIPLASERDGRGPSPLPDLPSDCASRSPRVPRLTTDRPKRRNAPDAARTRLRHFADILEGDAP